jgi:membrane fusion protein (multidrug efflux system)
MATTLSSPPDQAPPTPAAPNAAPRRSTRPILLGLLAVIVLAGGTVGVRRYLYGRTHESTENAQVDGHIVPVIAKVSGFVRHADIVENTPVAAGDTLVTIDDAEYRVRLAQATAELEAARAVAGGRGVAGQSEALERGAASQQQVLAAQVRAAEASYQKATADFARLKELADKQIISRQQLDAAQFAVDNASAALQGVQRQLAGAAAGVSGAEAGTRLAQARRAAALAARDNAALQLSYTAVVAPRDGLVARKQVDPGQLVQAGQPLLTIVDEKDIWITANFKETQLARLRVGQAVDIDVDAYSGCTARGVVESLSGATGARFALLPPDNATGNFTKVVQRLPVRIRITRGCGADRPLRPGMSVTTHVETT